MFDPVLAVAWLALGPVELVGRIGNVRVSGPLIGLAGPPPAQRSVGLVEVLADHGQALVPFVVERPG